MIFGPPRRIESWGRVVRPLQEIAQPSFREQLPRLMDARNKQSVLPTGLHRSYGDSNLNTSGRLIDMSRLDRVIAFDVENGILRAEAGLSLGDVLRLTVPYGWFLKTTPGTRFVSLGGAVANDVHGKNHRFTGSFGNCVRRLGLVRTDGTEYTLSPENNADLFSATIGGLGLTGAITWVEIELAPIVSSDLEVERIPFGNISDFFSLSIEAKDSHEHTVAWVDCASTGQSLGRGIFQRANWSQSGQLCPHSSATRMTVPFEAPIAPLNRITVKLFNNVYYRMQRSGAPRRMQHYASFFYPLDGIGHWNRLYGPRGLYQYQCVIPPKESHDAIEELVSQISKSGAGSFLAVLKTLGPIRSCGLISFPREGATLALDFANRGHSTLDLFARLDRVVVEAGGALYAAKDGRVPKEVFRAGYPLFEAFRELVDPAISSDFWRRVDA